MFFLVLSIFLADFLVMHLQELVRMVFIAATAICDQLKLEGLSTLQVQLTKYVVYIHVGNFKECSHYINRNHVTETKNLDLQISSKMA